MIYIFIVALFLLFFVPGVAVTASPNVGTVLFTQRDAHKRTWPKNKLALLKARLYAQHLIPPLTPPQTPDFVDSLLTYFHNCYTAIRQESQDPETDQILTTAFTDVVGGYLKTFALPLTKYGYYGGSLPKEDALKLFLFYEDVKNYLGKSDSGWAGPDLSILNAMTISAAMPPFTFVRRHSYPDPCHYLAYFQKTPDGLVIPTPIIDWNSRTMFVPLANQTLINLYSANVSNALHKYYDVALNCVRSKRPSHLDSFNERFQSWLKADVMPHLNDDHLYVALAGVLNLVNSTNDLAAYTAYEAVMSPEPEDAVPRGGYHPNISTKIMIVLLIVAVEILWCIPTLVYMLCMRRRNSRSRTIASHINTILETRRNERSDSESGELEDDTSKIHFLKRRGGLKLQLRPNSPVVVREVSSSHTVCAADTNTCGRRVPRRPDAATIVDEAPRKRSNKVTQTKQASQHAGNRAPTANPYETGSKQPSNDTSKAILSVHSPSEAATIRLSRRLKKSTDASVESCERDRLPPCLPCLSKENTKNTGKVSETVVATASADITPVESDYSSKDHIANGKDVTTSDDVTNMKPLKRVHKRKVTRNVKESKAREEKPFLEIRIDRPHRGISVDVMRNRDVKKVIKEAKKSKIPKRSVGAAVGRVAGSGWKPPGPQGLATHKSMIPKLNWAADDTALLRDIGTKAPKLNVTL